MELSLIGFTWIAFFLIHSLTASDSFKERIRCRYPHLCHLHRIVYNVVAILSVIPAVALVTTFNGPDLYAPAGAMALIDRLIQLLAALGFAWALMSYDLSEMTGYLDWREGNESPATSHPQPSLRCNGALRYSRHPLYFFALVLLWSGTHNAATLLTAVLITVYLIVGIQIEERRLARVFGIAYVNYCRQVPILLPLAWRWFEKKRRPL